MATLSELQAANGIQEDEKNIQRAVSSAVSQLNIQADIMLQLSAFLFDDYYNNAGVLADAAHIAEVTAKFQAELVKLGPIMQKFAEIESFGNATNGPANLDAVKTARSINTAAFTDRYK